MNFAKPTAHVYTPPEKLVRRRKSVAPISFPAIYTSQKWHSVRRRSRVLHDRRVKRLRQRRLVCVRRLNWIDGSDRLRKPLEVPLFPKVLDGDELPVEPPAVQGLERATDRLEVATSDVDAAVARHRIDGDVEDPVTRSALLEDRVFDRDVPVVAVFDVGVEHVADLEAGGERRVALDSVAVLPERLTLPDLGDVGGRGHPAPDDEFYRQQVAAVLGMAS